VTLILLTNDDGIEAEGLHLLEEALGDLGEVVVVAPDRERSAVSHSLTIRSPLVVRHLEGNRYALNGTPVDCVIYALTHILLSQPDMVVSGINHGANLGDDIMYSGTVAAAREASKRGFAAIAISQAYENHHAISFDAAAKFVRKLVGALLEQKPQGSICLNVNIPVHRVRGVKITRQGCSLRFPHFNWLDRVSADEGEEVKEVEGHAKSDILPDYEAVSEDYISITPLQRDQTDYAAADWLLKEVSSQFRRFRVPGIGLID
jgi:5'-nucleotidase